MVHRGGLGAATDMIAPLLAVLCGYSHGAFTVSPTTQGQALLAHLQALFAGHPVRAEDVVIVSETTEQYPVHVYVVWQFTHDVSTRSVPGNAAIEGGHFGQDDAAFQDHLQALCHQAVHDREIRGPFMQLIDSLGAQGLTESSQHQTVHDFGSYSRLRSCGACRGSGAVACGSCNGRGKRPCGGCGGGGRVQRHVTRTRWNGRFNESYREVVYESCSTCYGGVGTACITHQYPARI